MDGEPSAPLTPEEWAVAHILGRGALYRLLGGAFAPPLAWRFQELAHVATMAAAAPVVDERLRGPLARFADAARDADPAAVAAEYVSLFDRQARCSPYEGAYRGAGLAGKGVLLADVAGFYAAFGLGPAAGAPDMEDHVAAELEFMSALCFKEAHALAISAAEPLAVTRDAEAAFLRDHLGGWAAAFARDLDAATALGFYTAAAALLAAWMDIELAALGVAPVPVAGRVPGGADEEALGCPVAGPAGGGRRD